MDAAVSAMMGARPAPGCRPPTTEPVREIRDAADHHRPGPRLVARRLLVEGGRPRPSGRRRPSRDPAGGSTGGAQCGQGPPSKPTSRRHRGTAALSGGGAVPGHRRCRRVPDSDDRGSRRSFGEPLRGAAARGAGHGARVLLRQRRGGDAGIGGRQRHARIRRLLRDRHHRRSVRPHRLARRTGRRGRSS